MPRATGCRESRGGTQGESRGRGGSEARKSEEAERQRLEDERRKQAQAEARARYTALVNQSYSDINNGAPPPLSTEVLLIREKAKATELLPITPKRSD
jgi:hypothetical protein